jgi:dihydrofolate reductase
MISLIAAMSTNRVIGKNNQLPWNLPEDLKWFMEKTNNCPIIMGRKTHESIGRALKNRDNIIITRNTNYKPISNSIFVYNDLHEAINKHMQENKEIFIIGGQELFEQAIKDADKMYLTIIDAFVAGDTYFPKLNDDEWSKVYTKNGNDITKYNYTFNIYERKNDGK